MTMMYNKQFEHFNSTMGLVYQYEFVHRELSNKDISDTDRSKVIERLTAIAIELANCDKVPGKLVYLSRCESMILTIPVPGKDINIVFTGDKVSKVHLGSIPYSSRYVIFDQCDPVKLNTNRNVGNPIYITDYSQPPMVKDSVELVTIPFIIVLDECAFTGGSRYVKFRGCNYVVYDATVKNLHDTLLEITRKKPLTEMECKKLLDIDLSIPKLVVTVKLWKLK